MIPKRITSPRKQSGFALAELMVASIVAATLLASIALYLNDQRKERIAGEYAAWVAQYVNAVASYMSSQGLTPPGTLIQNGTDWLKSNTCGGIQPPDNYFLACSVPTNFNNGYNLGAPRVTFDWSTPVAPTATLAFGVVQSGGQPNPKMAALIASEVNKRLETDGFNHANVFTIDPAILPADPNFQTEVTSANLRGTIDSSIQSTVFVRRDGNTVMTGSLISEHDSWSLIARDSTGAENTAPQDPIASTNVNDVFVRSAGPIDAVTGLPTGIWASETYELAEEAYRLAVRAPLFVSNIRSGDSVSKPTCPAPMQPLIYAQPAGFIGGPNLTDARLISGVRTRINDNGASWRIFMDILYEGGAGFQTIPPPPAPQSDMGLIQVTVKCSS